MEPIEEGNKDRLFAKSATEGATTEGYRTSCMLKTSALRSRGWKVIAVFLFEGRAVFVFDKAATKEFEKPELTVNFRDFAYHFSEVKRAARLLVKSTKETY